MRRTFFKSKIHRATVTHADLEYEGSVTIDEDLMDAAGIWNYEAVHIWNITRGTRLQTYAIQGQRGSGVICINGAAAHLNKPGDMVILATFAELEESEARAFVPKVVLVDAQNTIVVKDGVEIAGPDRRVLACRCFFGAAAVRPLPDRETCRSLCKPGRAVPVRVEVDADTETPVSAFLKLAHGKRQAFLLESVEGGERSARFSFLGAGPRGVLRWKLGDGGDPLASVRAALASHRAVRVPGCPPFAGGLVGHVSYDAVKLFEPRVPISKPDELGFADVLLMDFDEVVAFDNLRHSLHVICEVRCGKGDDPRALYERAIRRIRSRLRELARPLVDRRARRAARPAELTPRVAKRDYLAAVERAKEYVRAGDCQQIVLSQRFDAEVSVPPFEIYRALRRVNPSPYLFFLQDGDRALVGSSPETLIKLQGGEVTLRPIAGTRRRGR